MDNQFDAVVIGMGPGGEVLATRLLDGGMRVAVVEQELIGGECAYWACIPSKSLLRGPEAQSEAERAAGTTRPELSWPELRAHRDGMVRHLDDHAQVDEYEKQGATVLKGQGRLAGRTSEGQLEVQVGEQQVLRTDHVVVATGSVPVRPPIEGLDHVTVWTNREATNLQEIPGRVLMLGGGAVAVELGQFLARMGSTVTLAERGERLVSREDPQVGELTRAALAADGVDVRLGTQVTRLSPSPGGVRAGVGPAGAVGGAAGAAGGRAGGGAGVGAVAELDDGTTVEVDVVVLGTGRRPRLDGLGLESVGIDVAALGRGGLPVDEHCGFGAGLWAVGDVTGRALFTHVAKYQARIAAAAILGRPRPARYDGVPRVIFADPEIAAVGVTLDQARDHGIDVATAEVDIPAALARPWTYELDPRGTLGLLADRDRGVLVGAWAVAPLASEWIHQAALAVRAEVPLETLRDQVAQFPTYTEAYLIGLEQLDA